MADKEHDKYAEHHMDTNGFTNNVELYERAQKRFVKASLAFCDHIESGFHDACDPKSCQFLLGLLDAHQVLSTS